MRTYRAAAAGAAAALAAAALAGVRAVRPDAFPFPPARALPLARPPTVATEEDDLGP